MKNKFKIFRMEQYYVERTKESLRERESYVTIRTHCHHLIIYIYFRIVIVQFTNISKRYF